MYITGQGTKDVMGRIKMKQNNGASIEEIRAEDNNEIEGSQGDGNEPTLVRRSGRIRKGSADPGNVAVQIRGINENRGRKG